MSALFKRTLVLLLTLSLVAVACGSDAEPEVAASPAPDEVAATADEPAAAVEEETSVSDACGADATKVGFLYVGPKDDFGYNQAAYEAAVAMGEATGVEVIHAANVPETIEDAVPVMEDMIAQGATILFPTSFGHFLPAVEIAKQNPDVCVVHQGQLESSLEEGPLDNLGTYFSSVFEPVYLAGIAAGATTETDVMGFVYAFAIPQTLQNINAFALGAQTVNPDATVIAVSTADWCDPAKQAQAAQTLLDQGADVLTQHQDCTKTIIEVAEAAAPIRSATTTTHLNLRRTAGSPDRTGPGPSCTPTSSRPWSPVTSSRANTTVTIALVIEMLMRHLLPLLRRCGVMR